MKASTIAFALLHGAASAAAGPEAEECKQAKSYLPSDKPVKEPLASEKNKKKVIDPS